jgi:hypothetical protein
VVDYSRLEFDEGTESALFEYALVHKLGLAASDIGTSLGPKDFKFHVTIFYSSVQHVDFQPGRFDIEPIDLIPKQFQLFGELNDHLVVELVPSDALLAVRDHYRIRYGHISDFEPYRPHITFRGPPVPGFTGLESLSLPAFKLRACRIIHEKRA